MKPLKAVRRRLFPFGGKVHVGVDISPQQVVCVKTRGQDVGFEVLATRVAGLPEGAEPGTDAFVAILRQTLGQPVRPGRDAQHLGCLANRQGECSSS